MPPIHTLFRISTSDALVAGIHSGAISVGVVLDLGDFGLGACADPDDEMIVLDGQAYQVHRGGRVSEAQPSARVRFAVVTRFLSQIDVEIEPSTTFGDLEARCDTFRTLDNILYAFRLDGRFDRIRARTVNPPQRGEDLFDAVEARSELDLADVRGTLVGLWSSGLSSAFGVGGYHFHFLSEDRQYGRRLLDCVAGPLRLKMEVVTDFHLALP